MNRILRKFIFPLTVFIFLWYGSTVSARANPRLYFEPATGSYNTGDAFNIVVKIDTSDEEAMATDALISFDQNKLKVNQVTSGQFFSGFNYNIENSNGRLTIYSYSEQALVTRSGVGDIATVSFEATAEGTAAMSFLCEAGNDTDTGIWDQGGNDIVNCGACGSGSYTIGGQAPTATPEPEAPTATPEPEAPPEAPTPAPEALPDTGIETPLIMVALGGGIMLLFSWLLAL